MKLTSHIFHYWWHHVNLKTIFLPNYTGMWRQREGLLSILYLNELVEASSFWYLLNHEWYRMNNVKFADTNCKEPYTIPDDDCYDHLR